MSVRPDLRMTTLISPANRGLPLLDSGNSSIRSTMNVIEICPAMADLSPSKETGVGDQVR